MTKTFDPILAICFKVSVDGHPLGLWSEAKLGGISVEDDTQEEGGNSQFVHHIPGQVSFENVSLSRYMNKETAFVAAWFRSMTAMVVPTTAEIVALSRDLKPVAIFSYLGVHPVRWSLPSFSVTGGQAATETLELAHHGFTVVIT
jgi:phage tail-like protein